MGGIRSLGGRLQRCAFRINRIREYASFADRLIVKVADAAQSLEHLTFCRSIDVRTDGEWSPWDRFDEDDPDKRHIAKMLEEEQSCKAEFPAILSTLSALNNIQDIRFLMSDIVNLPIRHQRRRSEDEGKEMCGSRTPITVLSKINISVECQDVCLWTLPDFPKVRIEDVEVRRALTRAREFPDRDSWRKFVAESDDPLLQAYDFTADFHSRDMTRKDSFGGKKRWVDLLPLGEGYMRIGTVDVDDFGCGILSRDLHKNLEFLSSPEGKKYWVPELYEWLRSAKPCVSSVLSISDSSNMDKAQKIVFDRPIWELSEEIREKLMGMLPLRKNEEYVWEEFALARKKKQPHGQEESGA